MVVAQALPRDVEQRLSRVLDCHRLWLGREQASKRPEVLQVLGGGLCNISVLVGDGARRYVVRLARAGDRRHRIDRAREFAVQRSAAACGLAPRPRWCAPGCGVLVSDYIDAASLPAEPLQQGQLMRAIHALPWRGPALRLDRQLERYRLRGIRVPGQALPRWLGASETVDRVLCHHDLLAGNLLITPEGAMAIDWEYAAPGSRWLDLAIACSALGEHSRRRFLRGYLGRRVRFRDRWRVAELEAGYAALATAWKALELRPGPGGYRGAGAGRS